MQGARSHTSTHTHPHLNLSMFMSGAGLVPSFRAAAALCWLTLQELTLIHFNPKQGHQLSHQHLTVQVKHKTQIFSREFFHHLIISKQNKIDCHISARWFFNTFSSWLFYVGKVSVTTEVCNTKINGGIKVIGDQIYITQTYNLLIRFVLDKQTKMWIFFACRLTFFSMLLYFIEAYIFIFAQVTFLNE